MEERFHVLLKQKINKFIHYTYDIAKTFPKEELYGLVMQLRRASISIMLNYVEGYARRRDKVKLNFYETSHGSTQECKYIIFFAQERKWISIAECQSGIQMADEISKMLWSTINLLEQKIAANEK